MSSRERFLKRWLILGKKLIDDSNTGYVEVYTKDGNLLHAKHVGKELIDLDFEQERSKQDTGSQQ